MPDHQLVTRGRRRWIPAKFDRLVRWIISRESVSAAASSPDNRWPEKAFRQAGHRESNRYNRGAGDKGRQGELQMRKVMRSFFAFLAAVAAAQTPDAVYLNGKIVTVDARFSIAEAIARRRPCTVASLTAESTVQELRDQSDFGKAIFFQEIVQPFASCAPAVVRGRPWLRSNVSYSLC